MLPGGSRRILHGLGHTLPRLQLRCTDPGNNGKLGSTVDDLSVDDLSVDDLSEVGKDSRAVPGICTNNECQMGVYYWYTWYDSIL